MYFVEFTKLAESQLNKLPDLIQNRILLALDRIRVRPYHFVKRKQGSPYFILRVGNHRVILEIKNDKLIILVLEVGPRKNIYK